MTTPDRPEQWINPRGDGTVYLEYDEHGTCKITREALTQLLNIAGWRRVEDA